MTRLALQLLRSAARREFLMPRFITSVSKYGGLLPSEMSRLKQLEEENNNLKRIVVDLSLDKVMLQDAIKQKL